MPVKTNRFLDAVRPALRLAQGGDSNTPAPQATTTGLPTLSRDTAAKVPIVGVVLQAVERAFQGMTIQGEPDNSLDILARRPNTRTTGPALWGWCAREAIMAGRALVEIERDAAGRLRHLWPSVGQPTFQADGGGDYRLQRLDEQRIRTVPPRDVLELSASLRGTPLMGTEAGPAVALLKLLDDAVSGVLDSGALVRYLLISDKVFRDGGLKKVADAFAKSYGRGVQSAHMPIVVDQSVEVKPLSADMRGAQIAELIQAVERRALSALGFPARYSEESAGLAELRVVYRQVVLPLGRMFAAEVERKLGISIEFNATSLLRGDPKERMEMYSAALGKPGTPGWLTLNEVRDKEGLPPIRDRRADQVNFGDQQPVTPRT